MTPQPIRAVLVDDEADALDILSRLLSITGEVEIMATASDVDSALEECLNYHPEIIFLDIDMPGKNGFELVKNLQKYNLSPEIIFVTAHNEFAIEAIRHAAFDYLLKPIDPEALTDAIKRYKTQRKNTHFPEMVATLLEHLNQKRYRFNTKTGFFYLRAEEIVYLKADGAYTDILCSDGSTKTVSTNLGLIEEMLLPSLFIRVNRSTIVYINHIQEVDRIKKICYLKVGEDIIELPATSTFILKINGG
ncbi:MAG: LytTR family DNA-binding domain-containing protein [Bacteroidetes bacterium]|nr:LytTR family DNA-binding domain-containing protein [Bacteroidota bacterium]